MLRLPARRARAQWPLLVALLAVVTLGATLLGTCALLVSRSGARAREAAASRAAPADVEVTAYTVTVRGRDARSVAADTRRVLTSSLAPFTATMTARGSSVPRSLPDLPAGGGGAETYLSGVEDLPAHARLVTGRWPRAAGARPPASLPAPSLPGASLEAVVLEPTARLLGLVPGSRVHLGAELSSQPAPALDVTVVGIAQPLPGTGWDRDPLAGTGYDLAYRDGRSPQPVPAYGPFLVDLADLLAGASTLDRLEITAAPDLSRATSRDLDTVTQRMVRADRELAGTLGDRVSIERVASRLPLILLAARDQQQVTAAVVLAVALLGGLVAATALALAGRLAAGVRAGETVLLSALGFSGAQLAAGATAEAGAIALVATGLAIPASSVAHAGLTHLPPLADAGLAVGPGVTGIQVFAVAGGAVALAAVLVLRAVRPGPAGADRRHRVELLARSGADLLLVVFAAIGWWQLRTQPDVPSSRADAVRVLAPALLLIAGAALAQRLVLPALRGADRLARRARGLVLPLAAIEAARRPQAVAAGLLVGLACATGTFGVAFEATWQRAQHDQADLSVGTDLALTLTAPLAAGQGAVVSAATGGTVSPAVDHGIAVGQWLGSGGDAPRLVAVDTVHAGALLRGRLDGGRTWTDVGAALAPPTPATGIAVPAGALLTLTGTATGDIPVRVTPRLVLQDATGLRTPCTGAPVPLDGTPHPLPACTPTGGLRLVAVSLPVAGEPTGADDSSRVAVTLTVPGSAAPPGPPWTATSVAPAPQQLADPAVTVTGTGAGTELGMTATVDLAGPPDAARDLVVTGFPDPGPVPVAVSARFADQIGTHRGAQLDLTVGTTPVPVAITGVLPTVPSAPGAAAVLADLDAMSRALIVRGNLDLAADAWWVGHPTGPDPPARAGALHLGTVTTRAAEATRLTAGPLRAGLPAALRLLVPAVVLLLLAGVVLHVAADLHVRALELARLRGLGMSRRQVRTMLVAQHAGVLLPVIALGAAVGALTTRLVAPLLVRSDTGAAPVPPAVATWPWTTEATLLALLLAGCALAVTAGVTVQARRADLAHLRVAT